MNKSNSKELPRPRRPLVLLMMAAAIPVVLFAGWDVFFNARQERTNARTAAQETLDRVVTRISTRLNAQVDVAETLASSSALDGPDLAKFYLEATRVKEKRPLWETISLVDPQGNQVLNLLRPFGADLATTADLNNFEKVLETGKTAIGGIGPVGQVSGKRLIALQVPIERGGKIVYVLTVSLTQDAVSRILRDAGAPKGVGRGRLSTQRVILSPARSPRVLNWGVPRASRFEKRSNWDRRGAYVGYTVNGVKVDTVFRSLPGTSGWSVHFGIPSDELNAPVRRSVGFLATGGAVSFALALALALFTARDIAQRRRDQEEKAELALHVSEERRTLAVDAADLGVVSWNLSTDEVQASRRTRELLGLPEPLAEHDISFGSAAFLEGIHPDDRASVERSFRQSAANAVAMEFRATLPGTPWRRAYARAPGLERAEPHLTFGIVMDIDAAKRAEIERIGLLRRLSEAEESERRRIAIELHDQIGQTVTGLSLGLKNLEQSLLSSTSNAAGLEKSSGCNR